MILQRMAEAYRLEALALKRLGLVLALAQYGASPARWLLLERQRRAGENRIHSCLSAALLLERMAEAAQQEEAWG